MSATSKLAHVSRIYELLTIFVFLGFASPSVEATERSDIFATGTVHSFGSYEVEGRLGFETARAGTIEIGRLEVRGTYNGPYPWIMRIYTDNTHYQGISGALVSPTRAGLVSVDGRFTIPLEVHHPNLTPNQFVVIPDLSDRDYATYQPPAEAGQHPFHELIIIGIDPRNATWVAGPDGQLFTDDDNPKGDITLPNPFTLVFQARFDASTAQGEYLSRLVIEVVSAP